MYDVSGKGIFNMQQITETTTIDISPDGIYILKISINGKASEWKVIKEK